MSLKKWFPFLILEKIGNLEIPFWDSDKESSKSSIPSWDHTPANSEEARNIAIKREIRKREKQFKKEA